jgi:hypothetical protein
LRFGGVSRRAETSLPGAASNRRCFGLGIAQDFNRRGGKGLTLPKAGRMGAGKSKAGAYESTAWRRVNLIRSYAGLEAENGTGVCGFEPCGLRRVDYV